MSQMGETNIFNMKKMMENPLANRGYMVNMVDKLKGIYGNDQQAAWALSQMSGGSINQTMAEELMGGRWDKFKEIKPGKGELDIYGRAAEGVGTTSIEVSAAKWKTTFEEIGNALIEDMNEIAKLFQKSKEDTKESLKSAQLQGGVIDKELDKLDAVLKKATK
jgi:hypothetical protein